MRNPRRSTLLATLILLSLFVLGCRGPSVNGPSITSWEEPGALKGGVSDLAAWDGSFYLLSFHRSSPGRALGVLQSYDGVDWQRHPSPLEEPTWSLPHWPQSTLLSSESTLLFWLNSDTWHKDDRLRAITPVGWGEPKPAKRRHNFHDVLALGPEGLYALSSRDREYALYRSPDLGTTWAEQQSSGAFDAPEGFRAKLSSHLTGGDKPSLLVDGKERLHIFRTDLEHVDENGDTWPKVFYSRSEDEGRTFSSRLLSVPHTAVIGRLEKGLTAVTNPSDPDFIAFATSSVLKPGSGVHYTASHDGGKTWKQPLNLNPNPERQCSLPTIGASGSVIAVAWKESRGGQKSTVKVAVSNDTGRTWSEGEVVGEARGQYLEVAVSGQTIVVTVHDGDRVGVFVGKLGGGGVR